MAQISQKATFMERGLLFLDELQRWLLPEAKAQPAVFAAHYGL